MSSFKRNGVNRRQFIRQTSIAAGAIGAGFAGNWNASAAGSSQPVSIFVNPDDPVASAPPVQWAVAQLRDALSSRGIAAQVVNRMESGSAPCIVVASDKSPQWPELAASTRVQLPYAPESLALGPGRLSGRRIVLAGGTDTRGLVYAILELSDRVLCAARPIDGITLKSPIAEQPANRIRSVARLFTSDVEDKSWFYDREFWQRYLTLLATQRFNRFSLTLGVGYDFAREMLDTYFYFAYPFLVAPSGYNVRAVPLPDEERDRNLKMLQFIGSETARRGLQFQLGLWTHAYEWANSPRVNYTIEGLSHETHGPYCRDALAAVLAACPEISGVTFRVHGESGVPERSYDFWKTVFDGIVRCGRKVEIDMHAKGMDQETIDVALGTGLPVNISPKYWAEHMGLPYMQGAIRPQELPRVDANRSGFFANSSGARSFLRYGYGDLMREDRQYGILHRIWPGTQRLLLWGSPEIARGYGRASSFCGSVGIELFEPLSFKGRKGSGLPGGRDAYAQASLKPVGGDFEKYRYTYRVWGRCLFNPETDADGWQRELNRDFGSGAADVEKALDAAGQILPLVTTAHCPSAANNDYWPEMYTNMSIVDARKPNPYGDTLSPKRFGTVSSLDPEFFSRIDDFAAELVKGDTNGKYSPAWVADQLLALVRESEKHLADAKRKASNPSSAEFQRFALDAAIQAGLGWFFAEKLRAGVWFALFEATRDPAMLQNAIARYRYALDAWKALAGIAEGAYVPDVTFGFVRHARGHWKDRVAAIQDDVDSMEKMLEGIGEQAPTADSKLIERANHLLSGQGKPGDRPSVAHVPRISFHRGEALPVEIEFRSSHKAAQIQSVQMRYRHVNQAEAWQAEEMQRNEGKFSAAIPGAYGDSPYPLQYHFELRSADGAAWLYPGLDPLNRRQPYFIVRQARV